MGASRSAEQHYYVNVLLLLHFTPDDGLDFYRIH